MERSDLFPRGRVACFWWLQLAAFSLLLSWVQPDLRQLWQQLDLQIFRGLNGSLYRNPVWDGFWAVTSLRAFDVLSGCVLLGLLLCKSWYASPISRIRVLARFLWLLGLLLVIRVLFARFSAWSGWQHAGPSTQLADVHLLSEEFPLLREFALKDASRRSFPGDHASILLLWGWFMWQLVARRGVQVLILAVTIGLMLPRLVAGAHWMTDDWVGGGFLLLETLAFGLCTPVLAWPMRLLARMLDAIQAWQPGQGRTPTRF